MRVELIANNKKELKFVNGSRIICATCGSKDVARGLTIRFAHLSEIGFMKDTIDRQLLAIEQALTPNGKIILESTANGLNYFSELWNKAERIHYCMMDKTEYNFFGDSIMNDLIPIMNQVESLLSKLDDAITTLSLNPIGVSEGQRIDGSIPKDIVGATINLEDGGDFKWVNAQMDYNNIKLLLDSLVQQLYAVAGVPASVIGQGNIANVSEVSLKLLFSQTDNKAKQTVQVLKEGFYKRFEYFRKLLAIQGTAISDDDYDSLDITFSVNRPVDTSSLMNELNTQYNMGAISKQTIIDISPYTVDVSSEMQRIEAEKGSTSTVTT